MDEYQKLTKTLGSLKKSHILSKKAKIREAKNHSIVTRNYAVPY